MWALSASENFQATKKVVTFNIRGHSIFAGGPGRASHCWWGVNSGVQVPWFWHSGDVTCQLWGWGCPVSPPWSPDDLTLWLPWLYGLNLSEPSYSLPLSGLGLT